MRANKAINFRGKNNTGYTNHNKVSFVRGGSPFFDQMLLMITEAKHSIHIQTYIFDDDDTGRLIGDALKKAAARGVKVYVMCDGYASKVITKSFITGLRDSGIHFRFFEPVIKSKYFYFGRRLHHKLIVTDTLFAMVGGINITKRYNDSGGYKAWLDFAVYAEGDIVKELCELCWKTWRGYPAKMKLAPCGNELPRYDSASQATSMVRMRRNDWVRNKNQISRSYIEMFRNAESHIIILCSYFLPGKTIRRNLTLAAKRGVNIKIILAGLSDVKAAKYAERFIYDWLLRYGMEVYEYQGNVLHGKIAVCDTAWLTIGSYNINNISAHASIELNLDIRDPVFAAEVEGVLDEIIKKECVQITTERLAKTSNIFNRFTWWLSYQTIKGLIYLFTFYFRKRS